MSVPPPRRILPLVLRERIAWQVNSAARDANTRVSRPKTKASRTY